MQKIFFVNFQSSFKFQKKMTPVIHFFQMERTYQSKSDALLERERHSIERLQKQTEVFRNQGSLQCKQ